MSKEGKTAIRIKMVQRRPGCPECQVPMVDAEYYPSDGGTYDVLLCADCRLVVFKDGTVEKLP